MDGHGLDLAGPDVGNRAQQIGQVIHPAGAGLATGASYSASAKVVIPAGFRGPYFLYVVTDPAYGGGPALTPGASEIFQGQNDGPYGAIAYYGSHVYEGLSDTNNILRGNINVTFREPDLTITSLTLPPGPILSGQNLTVTLTVANVGTRATRQDRWDDRIYLATDPSLHTTDLQLADVLHFGALDVGGTYRKAPPSRSRPVPAARWYLIAFANSDVVGTPPRVGSRSGRLG